MSKELIEQLAKEHGLINPDHILFESAKDRLEAFAKAYQDAAPIDNVIEEALSKANIPDARKFIFHGLSGCSNHGCIVYGPRTGMGTNGPCHCVSELSRQQLNMLGQRLDHFIRALIPTQANRTEG
jgi:hypothetical protein